MNSQMADDDFRDEIRLPRSMVTLTPVGIDEPVFVTIPLDPDKFTTTWHDLGAVD